ncbi:MAG: hypothetical protein U9N45_08150, partial [Gemmatimonadota bacterium]|nr:hypothetical protein [Gemmatimonadota bacterium]
MRVKLLKLAGQIEADKGKVHLEIKNRLDTRMWKFQTGAWEWAVPHILALADGGGTVSMNGYDYVIRRTDETEDFFKVGRKKPKAVLFRVDRDTGEKIMAESLEVTSAGYRAVIDGTELNFTESDIDKEINYDWIPDVYQGQDCRMDRKSQSGLEEFCAYVRRYRLVPTMQVSYERLEFVSPKGKKEKLLERLVPLALEYRRKIKAGGPEAAYWKDILRSPAGKYLRAILRSKDPENPDIKVDPKDLEYLRMTIDMNVRCRECDDLHNPTLFTGLHGFKRIWPNHTILEVKYRTKKAPQWVYDMVGELDNRRERKSVNDLPIRRQPAGKYCDSVTVWLYEKYLKGHFRIRSLGQAILRIIGFDKGYPDSANAPKWAIFEGKRFNEVLDIDPENPHIEPYGIPPMGYGAPKKQPTTPTVDDADDDENGNWVPEDEKDEDPPAKLPGKASLERSGVHYRLLEASGDEELANAFADGIFSMYREKREIVFAFDRYLGGSQGPKAIRIFEAIDELKKEYPKSGFLQNITQIKFDPSRIGGTLKEKIDSKALVCNE